jgi:hypothetical protein
LEEATDIAEEFLKCKSLAELYDDVLIPALSLAEEDRHRGKLDERRQQFIFQNTRVLVEELAERTWEPALAPAPPRSAAKGDTPRRNGGLAGEAKVVCIPARDEADSLAALMLAQLLNQRGIGARALSAEASANERLEAVGREHPRVACVSAVPPLGYMHARYLCRRLHAQFQEVRVVGAILTEHEVSELRERQPPLPADELASSLGQVLNQVTALLPLA